MGQITPGVWELMLTVGVESLRHVEKKKTVKRSQLDF